MRLPRTFYLLPLIVFTLLLTTLTYADNLDGWAAYRRGDYATALNEFLPLAKEGNVYAQYFLGGLYNFGQGVPKDYAQAREWYLKAAAQGSPNAQFSLGLLYEFGRGVPQDYRQARKWWLKAAAQGRAEAQLNLGLLYAHGEDVSQDYVQAHMWVGLAVAQGHEKAVTARNKIAQKMNQEQIAEAQQLAHEWKPKTLQVSEYTLDLKKNNTLVHLQGGLGLGVSDEVTQLLATHLDVNGIILDSQGGWIHEGQKLADLISSYGLDTYSLLGCYSACTTAFIAGKNRFLGPQANLAFHQYTVPGFKSLQTDEVLKKEEEKDRKIFQQQGVSAEFLEKLFNAPFDDLWYPPVEELLNAQVVHSFVNPSDIFPYDYDKLSSSEIKKGIVTFTNILP